MDTAINGEFDLLARELRQPIGTPPSDVELDRESQEEALNDMETRKLLDLLREPLVRTRLRNLIRVEMYELKRRKRRRALDRMERLNAE